jgi:membrane protein YdbS with pleckstrin-like domain
MDGWCADSRFPASPAISHRQRLDDIGMPQQADPLQVPSVPHSRHRTKPCPFCAETIRYAAIKCRFCGEFLSGDRRQGQTTSGPGAPGASGGQTGQNPALPEEGSDLLWFGRPSIFALAGTFLKIGCFTALCWLVYRYPVMRLVAHLPRVNVSTEHLARIEVWLDLAAFGLGLAAALSFIWRIIDLKSISYEVTPDRIEWSRGIFDRKVDNIDMFRVIDLKLRRSLLECCLGIGTVVLITNDQSDPHFEFLKVRQCRYLYDILKQAGLNADKKRGVIHLE